MKTFAFVVVLLAPAALAQSTAPVVLETGPHHRLVEWVEERLGPDGQLTAEVHQYTELATGLHYWDEEAGQWLESVEAFELLPHGYAVARRGQHKVLIAGNINAGGSVDLELPDGRRLLSNPMGLSYLDASSGRNVLLAEVKDCAGEQMAPEMILFPDAFEGLKAALRYTYTLGGFEQDVILLEDPGPPELYGLDPAWTTPRGLYRVLRRARTGGAAEQSWSIRCKPDEQTRQRGRIRCWISGRCGWNTARPISCIGIWRTPVW
jgi:hypothetical protein